MSASDKLRALEEMAVWDSETVNTVGRIFPQIRALVEAAEIAQPVMELALSQSGINATPGHMLREALAALDEALP